MSLMNRLKASQLPVYKLLAFVMGLVAFTAMALESASAHDEGCDGNPVPVRIKLDCCGAAEEHRLR